MTDYMLFEAGCAECHRPDTGALVESLGVITIPDVAERTAKAWLVGYIHSRIADGDLWLEPAPTESSLVTDEHGGWQHVVGQGAIGMMRCR